MSQRVTHNTAQCSSNGSTFIGSRPTPHQPPQKNKNFSCNKTFEYWDCDGLYQWIMEKRSLSECKIWSYKALSIIVITDASVLITEQIDQLNHKKRHNSHPLNFFEYFKCRQKTNMLIFFNIIPFLHQYILFSQTWSIRTLNRCSNLLMTQ